MSIRKFVSGTSVVLMGWLGATFLNEVPAQRYPKLDKSTSADSASNSETGLVAFREEESGPLSVSTSH